MPERADLKNQVLSLGHPAGSHICGIKSDNEERHLGQNGQIRYPSESASADHFPQERLDCDRQFQD